MAVAIETNQTCDSLGFPGVFVLNVVSRVEEVHRQLQEKMQKYFTLSAEYKMEYDVNRLLFLSNMDDYRRDYQLRERLIKAAQDLDKLANEKINKSVVDPEHFWTTLK